MTITTKEYKVYTIESHPNPIACYDWIRNNWHDLGDNDIEEAVYSLKAFALHIGAKLDYSISIVPCRGEFIRFYVDDELTIDDLSLDLRGDCPFTGTSMDEVILDAFRTKDNETLQEALEDVEYRVLGSLHSRGEHLYSDEGLEELCECNEYQFKACGHIEK